MELEITWKRTLRIFWAFLWRNLCAVIISVIIGSIFGFVIGLVLGLFGVNKLIILYLTTTVGLLTGLLISILPVRMILGKNFGEFRLVLMSNEDENGNSF